ncbi:uncharacterized protein LOC143564556 [Bidens hawaiensis]|uniref:uncharacterized protein LOC143564556 n=1 Tax=Bidens hawaiensis TaxID=980011 RepID=UPI004049A064
MATKPTSRKTHFIHPHHKPHTHQTFSFYSFQFHILLIFLCYMMPVSDIIVNNLTILYITLIVFIKCYAYLTGRCYGGAAVLVLSTTVVGVLLVVTLTWDVSRKLAHEMCRGGICWHGVAVKSPASHVRFRLPQRRAVNQE